MKIFLTWVRMILHVKPRVVIHENVVEFGLEELQSTLGGLYLMWRVLTDPPSLGFPVSRPRQKVFLVLKAWLITDFSYADVPVATDVFPVGQLFSNMFTRYLAHGTASYLIAEPAEVQVLGVKGGGVAGGGRRRRRIYLIMQQCIL